MPGLAVYEHPGGEHIFRELFGVDDPVGGRCGPPGGLNEADGDVLFAVSSYVDSVRDVDSADADAGRPVAEWDNEALKTQRLCVEIPCRFLCGELVKS